MCTNSHYTSFKPSNLSAILQNKNQNHIISSQKNTKQQKQNENKDFRNL